MTTVRWPLSSVVGLVALALLSAGAGWVALDEPPVAAGFGLLSVLTLACAAYVAAWRLDIGDEGLRLRSVFGTGFIRFDDLRAFRCAREGDRVVIVERGAEWIELVGPDATWRVQPTAERYEDLVKAITRRGCLRRHGRPPTALDRWLWRAVEGARVAGLVLVLIFLLLCTVGPAFLAVEELGVVLTGDRGVDVAVLAGAAVAVWWVGAIVLGGVRRTNLLRDLPETGMSSVGGFVAAGALLVGLGLLFSGEYGPGASVSVLIAGTMIAWEVRRHA